MSGGINGNSGTHYRTDPAEGEATPADQLVRQIRTSADVLAHSIRQLSDPIAREQALLRLNESLMWATRGK